MHRTIWDSFERWRGTGPSYAGGLMAASTRSAGVAGSGLGESLPVLDGAHMIGNPELPLSEQSSRHGIRCAARGGGGCGSGRGEQSSRHGIGCASSE